MLTLNQIIFIMYVCLYSIGNIIFNVSTIHTTFMFTIILNVQAHTYLHKSYILRHIQSILYSTVHSQKCHEIDVSTQ